ncbi:hypothetical protein TALC_01023 [Thermoplasmatales archaeon BRNA1]|nr:hypothetical protein TALC_01023 [Thermoplasmatales archaeon BRNA1]
MSPSNGDDVPQTETGDSRIYFDDRKGFGKLCGSMGIPHTDNHLAAIGEGLSPSEMASIVRESGCDVPVILQGDEGTFVVGDFSDTGFLAEIGKGASYSMSSYMDPSIPVSVIADVSDTAISLRDPFVVIQVRDSSGRNFRLADCGRDYTAYSEYSDANDANRIADFEFRNYSKRICKSLHTHGFSGSVRINALIIGTDLRFTSISTVPEGKDFDKNVFVFKNLGHKEYFSGINNGPKEHFFSDGCITSKRNLVSALCGGIALHPNLDVPDADWEASFTGRNGNLDLLALKLELINRGVRLPDGGICSSILELGHDGKRIRVKPCPNPRIAELSPFRLEGGSLFYLEYKITDGVSESSAVRVEGYTRRGVPFSDIAEIEEGSLRIRHYHTCEYVRKGAGCKFCKYTCKEFKLCSFSLDDISEAIDVYLASGEPFDRVVIGGGCMVEPHDRVVSRITDVAKIVLEKVKGKPLHLACPPPTVQTDMDTYKAAGISGITISVEVFDPPKSREYLPGKDRVPLSAFYYTMKHAVDLWGGKAVFSNLIAGLESPETTREGCAQISSMGASPVIAPFRPIPGTPLQNVMPLAAKTVYSLHNDVRADCRAMGIVLGPGHRADACDKAAIPEADP